MTTKKSSAIRLKFTGVAGKRRLVEALAEQFLIGGDKLAAKIIAAKVDILEFSRGKRLMLQGESEDDLYFVLGGSVSIVVNAREIAIRKAGDHVGEMSLLDTTARRSASVHSREHTVVAKISEENFSRIASKHYYLWRRVALALAVRLRERNKFQIPPRDEPNIFIGSSSEGLKFAECIHSSLCRVPLTSRLWTSGVFQCTKTTIEDLIKTANEVDFAVLVLTADDLTISRGAKKQVPRDNVIFELGLFMGALSRERTYIVAKKSAKPLKLPSDLLGVTVLNFEEITGKSIAQSLRPVIKQLKILIERHGPM